MNEKRQVKSVLFVCNMNQIRSPMAEFLTKDIFGETIYAQSAGIYIGDEDGFMQFVMEERGLDVSDHKPESLNKLEDTYVDLVITLAQQAREETSHFFKGLAVDLEHWDIENPSIAVGQRDTVLSAYRQTREQLENLIKKRFTI